MKVKGKRKRKKKLRRASRESQQSASIPGGAAKVYKIIESNICLHVRYICMVKREILALAREAFSLSAITIRSNWHHAYLELLRQSCSFGQDFNVTADNSTAVESINAFVTYNIAWKDTCMCGCMCCKRASAKIVVSFVENRTIIEILA